MEPWGRDPRADVNYSRHSLAEAKLIAPIETGSSERLISIIVKAMILDCKGPPWRLINCQQTYHKKKVRSIRASHWLWKISLAASECLRYPCCHWDRICMLCNTSGMTCRAMTLHNLCVKRPRSLVYLKPSWLSTAASPIAKATYIYC